MAQHTLVGPDNMVGASARLMCVLMFELSTYQEVFFQVGTQVHLHISGFVCACLLATSCSLGVYQPPLRESRFVLLSSYDILSEWQ
eukprot:2575177-Amphidinium_carterae.1